MFDQYIHISTWYLVTNRTMVKLSSTISAFQCKLGEATQIISDNKINTITIKNKIIISALT